VTEIDEWPSSLEKTTTSTPAARSSSANVCRSPSGCTRSDRVSARALAARLPRSAQEIATEVVRLLDTPKDAREPVTVRSVTVKLVRTKVIASETLMLAVEREIYP
jgi:hypothetical protein